MKRNIQLVLTQARHTTTHFDSFFLRLQKKKLQILPALTLLTQNVTAQDYQKCCPGTVTHTFFLKYTLRINIYRADHVSQSNHVTTLLAAHTHGLPAEFHILPSSLYYPCVYTHNIDNFPWLFTTNILELRLQNHQIINSLLGCKTVLFYQPFTNTAACFWVFPSS